MSVTSADFGAIAYAGDTVSGTLPPDAGEHVTVYENDERWAGVPVTETEGRRDFSCRLRPVAEQRLTSIEVRDSEGSRVFARRIVLREVLRNAYGLRASDVFDPGHPPLVSLPWVSFDGVRLTIGGGHLPPGGDPSSLSVRAGDGVVVSLDYPRPAPGWAEHYWYWPNANIANMLLTIDLVASANESNPFYVEFIETKNGRSRKLSDLWIPSDLHSFLSFTTDKTKIDRVQRGIDASSIVLPGYTSLRYFDELFRRNGIDTSVAFTVLDWGCGVGRLTAHALRGWPAATVHGTDIDAGNVEWCRSNLATGHFEVAPLWPPTGYGDATFDAIFGVSVMTHLTEPAQRAWLAELARITRPGGIALITFAGPAGVASGSRWRSQTWWDEWKAAGFDAETRDAALAGHIEDEDYYRQASQTVEHVRATWSPHFEIVDIVCAAFGNQDLAVLRRR